MFTSPQEDSIQVHCRIKPSKTSILSIGADGTVAPDSQHKCRFHHVFDSNATQEQVFAKTALPLVESVCEGYNATLFAYGQTGSGKTHTICGSESDPGIVPRVAKYFVDKLDADVIEDVQFSVFEVYMGNVFDLLGSTEKKLMVRESSSGKVYIQGLKLFPLVSMSEFLGIFKKASDARKVASTNQNERSTRSHMVGQFKVLGITKSGVRFESEFNATDLAGSERVEKSGVEGKEFDQAVSINQSLSTLRLVVLRIKEGAFPPFRQDTLTRVLETSIKGNCKTRFIFTLRPEPESQSETTGTIQFAVDCSFLRNTVSVSRVETIESLRRQLSDAFDKIANLQLENASLKLQLKQKPPVTLQSVTNALQEDDEEPPSELKRDPKPRPAYALHLVSQRVKRAKEAFQSLPTNLDVYAEVASSQFKLNTKILELEAELSKKQKQVERLTALVGKPVVQV